MGGGGGCNHHWGISTLVLFACYHAVFSLWCPRYSQCLVIDLQKSDFNLLDKAHIWQHCRSSRKVHIVVGLWFSIRTVIFPSETSVDDKSKFTAATLQELKEDPYSDGFMIQHRNFDFPSGTAVDDKFKFTAMVQKYLCSFISGPHQHLPEPRGRQ